MSVRWILFPRSSRPVPEVVSLISVFDSHHSEIDSARHNLPSNSVLSQVSEDLLKLGFLIELSKRSEDKIPVPVLFGLNGEVEKSFNADGFHPKAGIVLEVEAGRAVDNNQFLKDIFQACAMQDAKHLVLCVRNNYRGADDFSTVRTFLETLYVSNRLRLPLDSVTLIGY